MCVYPILCGVGTGILALLVQVGQEDDNYGDDYDDGDCDDDGDCGVMSMVLPFLVHVGRDRDGDDDGDGDCNNIKMITIMIFTQSVLPPSMVCIKMVIMLLVMMIIV